jgi:hypothetical protein
MSLRKRSLIPDVSVNGVDGQDPERRTLSYLKVINAEIEQPSNGG